MYNKQLLVEIFVVCKIIGDRYQARLITPTSTPLILRITKTLLLGDY